MKNSTFRRKQAKRRNTKKNKTISRHRSKQSGGNYWTRFWKRVHFKQWKTFGELTVDQLYSILELKDEDIARFCEDHKLHQNFVNKVRLIGKTFLQKVTQVIRVTQDTQDTQVTQDAKGMRKQFFQEAYDFYIDQDPKDEANYRCAYAMNKYDDDTTDKRKYRNGRAPIDIFMSTYRTESSQRDTKFYGFALSQVKNPAFLNDYNAVRTGNLLFKDKDKAKAAEAAQVEIIKAKIASADPDLSHYTEKDLVDIDTVNVGEFYGFVPGGALGDNLRSTIIIIVEITEKTEDQIKLALLVGNQLNEIIYNIQQKKYGMYNTNDDGKLYNIKYQETK